NFFTCRNSCAFSIFAFLSFEQSDDFDWRSGVVLSFSAGYAAPRSYSACRDYCKSSMAASGSSLDIPPQYSFYPVPFQPACSRFFYSSGRCADCLCRVFCLLAYVICSSWLNCCILLCNKPTDNS